MIVWPRRARPIAGVSGRRGSNIGVSGSPAPAPKRALWRVALRLGVAATDFALSFAWDVAFFCAASPPVRPRLRVERSTVGGGAMFASFSSAEPFLAPLPSPSSSSNPAMGMFWICLGIFIMRTRKRSSISCLKSAAFFSITLQRLATAQSSRGGGRVGEGGRGGARGGGGGGG